MFEKFVDDPIVFETKKSEIEVPNSQILQPITQIWEMALWIISSFEEDCTSTKIFDEEGNIIWNEEFRRFCLRNTSRTMSYIDHVTIIEKLLNTAVREITKGLGKSLTDEIKKFIEDNLKAKAQEFKRIKKHRDKVSGHPSYISPKNGDTRADMEASLDCWGGAWGFTGNDAKSFRIGGLLPIIDGVEANKDHYDICLYAMHQFMKHHFEDWEVFLSDLLNRLEKLGEKVE